MSKLLHPLALFRLSVLGELTSRNDLQRGDLKRIVRELASRTFQIPGSKRVYLSEHTILRWYYDWKSKNIEGLLPKQRRDKGKTLLSTAIQQALIHHKKDNPSRSLNTLIELLEKQGLVAKNQLSRATVHRFLQQQTLSKRVVDDKHTIERRSFVAEHAGDIWQGDVLHGPRIQTSQGIKKTYLVSLMDDASRLIVHSAFCLSETAVEIEGVLKQAVLKRGIPYKLIIDNGAAYRSSSLQSICALLDIRLIYCRPYEPEGKGKLERFHRTFRAQFLNEINLDKIVGLDDLNARLWAWLDSVYHVREHTGLDHQAPLERWRQDLIHVRPLGFKVQKIDDIFCHRIERTVHKDGTVNFENKKFEVAFALVNKKINLVIDPHMHTALRVESLTGEDLGPVTLLDKIANLHRKRVRPHLITEYTSSATQNSVELAYEEYQATVHLPKTEKNK